jgi:hypothetical protein
MRSDSTPTGPWIVSRTLAALGAFALLGASPALASSSSGSQNPDLTVLVAVASQGTVDPERATAGDTVSGQLSLTVNEPWSWPPALEKVKVILTLAIPSGESFALSSTLDLPRQQTINLPFSFTVPAFIPPGTYALTLAAIEVDDPGQPPSSATATLTIY